MPIATLYERGIAEFLAEERDRPGDLWLFLHIPKTAGSSLGTELGQVLNPAKHIGVDYLDASKPFLTKLDESVEAFIAENAAQKYRLGYGHIRAKHVERIRGSFPQVKPFTMLRDPVRRVISDYQYQRRPMHPLHKEFTERYASLESYVEDPISHDVIFNHLALAPDEPVQEVINRVNATYAFVGTLETYPMSFRLMFRLLGANRGPTVHERKSNTTEQEFEPRPSVLKAMRDRNARDIAIVDHFRLQTGNRRGEVWKVLDAVTQ